MIEVRSATEQDAAQMCRLLNEIVEIGGTTAREDTQSEEEFLQSALRRPDLVKCLVAELDGVVLGFQSLTTNKNLPDDCADIATFARARNKVRGVGRALFTQTQKVARMAGFNSINATIRADNVPGLGYYAAMGFVDYNETKAVPLKDGTPFDRIGKRFEL